jgi:hypothetical protein
MPWPVSGPHAAADRLSDQLFSVATRCKSCSADRRRLAGSAPNAGSVLMTIILHAAEGSIQAEGLAYTGLLTIVAIGVVIFDWKMWRSPAPSSARTSELDQPQELSPGTAS